MCGRPDDPTQHDEEAPMDIEILHRDDEGFEAIIRPGPTVDPVIRRRELEENAVTLNVRLDWLVKVKGTTDIDEAREIVADYIRDQSELAESLDIERPNATAGHELTLILYPDDEEVPEHDELREADTWSTYHRTPA